MADSKKKAIRGARSLLAATVLATLAACAVGPDYRAPELAVPAAYTSDAARIARGAAGAVPTVSPTDAVAPLPDTDAPFWQRFEDPLLDELVATALRENHDLKVALARFDEANALLREAKFDYLPTVTADATASSTRSSIDQLAGAPGADRDVERYSAQINVGWELDVFGRLRRNVESQRAEAAASAADLAAVQVAIVGEVARSYLELRGLQQRLAVARSNAENQRETLRIVEARLDAGRGTEFDTSRARSQLETTLSRIPAFAAAVDATMHRLAVLTGHAPGALVTRLDASWSGLPALPGAVDAGAPGELLRRRPDVIAAERRLQAATARIGVATADLFPRFTLGGLVGTQAFDSSALFGGDSETRFVALGVDWSFLDVGRVRARIAASDAAASGVLAQYEQTVLRALEETENALVRYGHARLEDAHLERSARESARAAELARVRFDAGAADLLDVLDAERSQLQAQDAFADGRTRSATALVDLYRSLAGGWPQQAPERERVSAR
ncbi:MAG TPA: efflux transporter outer membrane subunit [Steroidobacteraceae bacterium]|nr:efflux transporter outer membrane subunit [Steroidobacteraceae bacterium]